MRFRLSFVVKRFLSLRQLSIGLIASAHFIIGSSVFSFDLHSPESFYRAEVLVPSQSNEDRKQAAKTGLLEVLYRVTGSPLDIGIPAVAEAVARAESMLVQFQYTEVEDANGNDALAIRLMFSAQLVDQVIYKNGLPFWPLNRPEVLVWLVEDSVEEGRVLVNDPENPIIATLQHRAAVRGLPLRLPLLDLDDQLSLTADDVWFMEEAAIIEASARYHADTIIVGRYSQTSQGEWLASWQYIHLDASGVFDERELEASQIGQGAVDLLANYLTGRYAVARSEQESPATTIEITNIQSFKEYRQALTYLQELAVISDLSLLEVNQHTVRLQATIVGGFEQLNNALKLDGRLESESPDIVTLPSWIQHTQGSASAPLRFTWVSSR